MNPLDAWVVATGLMTGTGEILHTSIDPLTVEFVRAFPYRAEIWFNDDCRVLAAGYIDDAGSFVAMEQEDGPGDGLAVLVIVDLLGVDPDALT